MANLIGPRIASIVGAEESCSVGSDGVALTGGLKKIETGTIHLDPARVCHNNIHLGAKFESKPGAFQLGLCWVYSKYS